MAEGASSSDPLLRDYSRVWVYCGWERSFLRMSRSSKFNSERRDMRWLMDLVSCCASAKPAISFRLNDCMFSISSLKASNFFRNYPTTVPEPLSPIYTFTRSTQTNRSSQSSLYRGKTCTAFSAILTNMALNCVDSSTLTFNSSFSFLIFVHSCRRV